MDYVSLHALAKISETDVGGEERVLSQEKSPMLGKEVL
jgi:hypothetical protein